MQGWRAGSWWEGWGGGAGSMRRASGTLTANGPCRLCSLRSLRRERGEGWRDGGGEGGAGRDSNDGVAAAKEGENIRKEEKKTKKYSQTIDNKHHQSGTETSRQRQTKTHPPPARTSRRAQWRAEQWPAEAHGERAEAESARRWQRTTYTCTQTALIAGAATRRGAARWGGWRPSARAAASPARQRPRRDSTPRRRGARATAERCAGGGRERPGTSGRGKKSGRRAPPTVSSTPTARAVESNSGGDGCSARTCRCPADRPDDPRPSRPPHRRTVTGGGASGAPAAGRQHLPATYHAATDCRLPNTATTQSSTKKNAPATKAHAQTHHPPRPLPRHPVAIPRTPPLSHRGLPPPLTLAPLPLPPRPPTLRCHNAPVAPPPHV